MAANVAGWEGVSDTVGRSRALKHTVIGAEIGVGTEVAVGLVSRRGSHRP